MTTNNKKKSQQPDLTKLFKSMGLQEEDLKRETSDEVMIPKMTLIGILETIEHVCESLKHTIITSPGKLNVGLLRLYFTAVTSSSVFALKILKMYERAAYAPTITKAPPVPKSIDPDALPVPPEEMSETDILEMWNATDADGLELEDIPLSDEEIADLAAIEVLDSESEIEDNKDEQSFDDMLKDFFPVGGPKGSPPDPKKQN